MASASAVYTLQTLSNPGTWIFLTAAIVAVVYGLVSSGGRFPASVGAMFAVLPRTVHALRWSILTIATVMALAYVMNFSGQTTAVGAALATTGAAFAFLSPVLGWIGTAVAGSATSAGALFANLQSTAAAGAGLDPHILLAANTIFLIKETSVVSVVALPDLVYVAKDLIGMSYNTSEALILLVIAYLVILLPVSIAARLIEKKVRRGGFGN